MFQNNIFRELRIIRKCFKRNNSTKNVLAIATERGIVQDIFPDVAGKEIKLLFTTTPQAIYAGFDPTANSLHVGNLLVLVGLLHCQRAGHQPIGLLGGATGLIGDPSGRKTERTQIGQSVIEENLTSIEKQIQAIFRNHKNLFWEKRQKKGDLKDIQIVNNAEWYSSINLIDFISNVGRHFRMGAMLSRTSVQTRLTSDSGMSFTEFTYQMFQAYDWLHLFKKYNCLFQFGGSDQMGNLMSGHELISKSENKKVYGMTLPLVTNEEGDKFGKSAGNAIWLDPKKTSPYALYQFFVRTPDSEVEKLLKYFTFLSLSEIKEIVNEHIRAPELHVAQKNLAQEITLLIHGEQGLSQATKITEALYKGNIEALGDLDYKDVQQTLQGCVIREILPEPGTTVLNMAMKAKCFPTESDAIRIITAGGFYINQKRAQNVSEVISPGIHILKNNITLLRVGKKNYYLVKWLK